MDITAEELDVVRRVLRQEVPRSTVATDCSLRLKTIVATAILQGAGVRDEDLIYPRGIYRDLMEEFVISPGLPAGGWSDKEYEKVIFGRGHWYSAAYGPLVKAAHRYGFHQTKNRQGHGVIFVGSSAFAQLFKKEPALAETCRTWYDEARQGILERHATEKAAQRLYSRNRRRLQRGFAELTETFWIELRHPTRADPVSVKELARELNKLIAKTFPDS